MRVEQVHAVLDRRHAVGDLREGPSPHRLLADVERRVVGAHRVDQAAAQAAPQGPLVGRRAQWRAHDVLRALEVGPLGVALVEHEVRDHGLDAEVDPPELGLDRLAQRLLVGEVHHVALGAGDLEEGSELGRARRLDHVRPARLVPLRPGLALGEQRALHRGDEARVLAVGRDDHAEVLRQLERGVELLVGDAEEPLVGQEDLERRHPVGDEVTEHGLGLVVEARDPDVERVVACRLAVCEAPPVVVALAEVLVPARGEHLDVGRRAADQRGLRAGGVGVLAGRAHEGQVDVHVRVDEAGEHVLPAGVDHLGAWRGSQVPAERGDHLALAQDVRLDAAARRDDLAVPYQ